MNGRWIGLLALCTAGCPQTPADYLAGRPAADAGGPVTADAAIDAQVPVGPRVSDVRRVRLDAVVEPRGLAVAGDRAWTTDRLDDRLVEFDIATGDVLSATPLPAHGARALARLDGALYIGYPDRLYRVDGGQAALVAEFLDRLVGLTAADEGLVTAEHGRLYVRSGPRMAPVLEVDLSRPSGLLARYGADYLMYDRSPRLDGVTFSVRLDVLDALSPRHAEVRGAIEVPVDLGVVTGIAVDGDRLYLIGAGYGADVGHLLEVSLTPEPGR